MTWQLTEGALNTIMHGGTVEDPVMQILGSKRIAAAGSSERYRLLVSDGCHLKSAMLATELNDKVTSGELSEYSVVRMNHLITKLVNSGEKEEKCVIIIVNLTILAKGVEVGMKIGSPVNFREGGSSEAVGDVEPAWPVLSSPAMSKSQAHDSVGSTTPQQIRPKMPNDDTQYLNRAEGHIFPIAGLSPYQNKWVIKARVVNKTPIKTYSNEKGQGKLFSMELLDKSGDIRATAFDEQCNKFHDLIEVDRVYFISRCQLKPAYKKYVNNDYEMTFTHETTVVPCNDYVTDIPHMTFNFIPLNKITDTDLTAVIDVIGVVKTIGNVEVIMDRKTNQQRKKCEITIVDQSNTAMVLKLWGEQAEKFSEAPGAVVAVKGVKQSDFGGGRSASVLMSSTLHINPDIPEAHQLRGWYHSVGHSQNHINISAVGYTPAQPIQNVPAELPSLTRGYTCPIANLGLHQNKLPIKARVVNKTPIKTYSNDKGEGKLFSVELVDKSGEIRATAFDEQCDKLYDLIEVNRVYIINKYQLKPASKKFISVNNDYELTFTRETTVVPCNQDVTDIPHIMFNFVPINKIADTTVSALVDVIGVVKAIGNVEVITVRTTNQERKKRDVTIVDKSKTAMVLTLWGEQAEKFSEAPGAVVAVKGVKQSDFGGGRSASVLMSSTLQVNPDIPEAHQLRDWYHSIGQSEGHVTISAGGLTSWATLLEMQDKQMGKREKPYYWRTKATVTEIRSKNCMYMSCAGENCNFKVIDMNNGNYKCEKCDRLYSSFKYRFLMSVCIGDWSGQQWVTCFQDTAEALLDMKVEEFGEIFSDENQVKTVVSKVTFKSFVFKLQVKLETYNNETRLKVVVIDLKPVDVTEYCMKMISDIKIANGMS